MTVQSFLSVRSEVRTELVDGTHGATLAPDAIPPLAANLFSSYQIVKAGCNPDDPELMTCLRSKNAFDFFMEKDDWPTNATLRPPLAPVMPWG